VLSDGSAVSYAELEAGAAQIAGHLVASGVAPGDRVGLQAEKSVEAVMIYLGVLKAGAVFLPLNSAYTRAEVDFKPGTGITGIRLSVRGVVPGLTEEQFVDFALQAKEGCPVSQALKAVPIELATEFVA